jgi:hypothetical protein
VTLLVDEVSRYKLQVVRVYLSARETLLSVKGVLRRLNDRKVLGSFYLEFGRRLEVLKLVKRCYRRGPLLSLCVRRVIPCALRRMGYEVVAFDVEPWPYVGIAECYSVEAVRRDLERLFTASLVPDCIVFSEVWNVNVKCINQVCLRAQFERC